MATAVVTVYAQGLCRSTATAIGLLGNAIDRIDMSVRFPAYNHQPTQQHLLCWAHLIRDLTGIAKPPGACAEFGAGLLGGPAATVI